MSGKTALFAVWSFTRIDHFHAVIYNIVVVGIRLTLTAN